MSRRQESSDAPSSRSVYSAHQLRRATASQYFRASARFTYLEVVDRESCLLVLSVAERSRAQQSAAERSRAQQSAAERSRAQQSAAERRLAGAMWRHSANYLQHKSEEWLVLRVVRSGASKAPELGGHATAHGGEVLDVERRFGGRRTGVWADCFDLVGGERRLWEGEREAKHGNRITLELRQNQYTSERRKGRC
jgi:hypothetical protein